MSSALLRALELARELAASRDPAAVLELVLRSALELTGARRGSVLEVWHDALTVRAGERDGLEPLARRALEAGGLVEGRSSLAAPLVARGVSLGAVVVEGSNGFTGEQKRLLELVAGHAALALDGARTRAALERAKEKLESRLASSEIERRALEKELAKTRSSVTRRRRFDRLVGNSPALEALLARLERCCEADLPVLIEGESGTGKELVARTLHEQGKRRAGPFVAVNVTELPEALLEPELFGHVRGAFTGAHEERAGLIREAEGGTLFLDEVGDMPASLQAKLLRFLQEGTVRPVGGGPARKVSVRIVAATNKDLRHLVRTGAFRDDLYFRLNVLPIEVPPLRARREDISVLASHFILAIAKEQKARARRLSREALAALEAHSWPGNVRELENAIRRAFVLGNEPIRPEDLGLSALQAKPGPLDLAGIEKETALRALEQARGNVGDAARALGIHRATLYRKLKSWGVAPP